MFRLMKTTGREKKIFILGPAKFEMLMETPGKDVQRVVEHNDLVSRREGWCSKWGVRIKLIAVAVGLSKITHGKHGE